MIRTLRWRLILSHVLPLLVIIPLLGIALVYVLETQVLLPNLASELAGQAALVAELATGQLDVWTSPAQAQVFVDRISPRLHSRIMLLSPEGQLLASSDPADVVNLGLSVGLPTAVTEAQSGQVSVHTTYSRRRRTEIADVLIPVVGSDQQVIGIVRLTHRLAGVYELFLRLRYLIATILAVGLILGVAVGWVLALDLERPLRRVSQAIYRLASGQQLTLLREEGPDEIRLLLQTVNTLVQRLRNLEQARRQLLANLVHELGRSLGALRSAIQALLGGADEELSLRRELLMGMDEAVDHLQRLLNDLAQLHDQLVGTLELNCRPVALSDWLPHVLVPWRAVAQEKGVYWEASLPTDLPTLEVDPDRLAQTLGNLLSNAVKYTPSGGTVSVGAGITDGAVWIQVRDTGPGIAAEEQAHIFTPFYRGQHARRFPQGMGLGLSIARDLAVAHGGRLEVNSTPGEGSCFTLWLPVNTHDA